MLNVNPNNFNKVLFRNWLNVNGLTQKDVAIATGFDASNISNIANGIISPRLNVMAKILQVYNVHPSIFEGKLSIPTYMVNLRNQIIQAENNGITIGQISKASGLIGNYTIQNIKDHVTFSVIQNEANKIKKVIISLNNKNVIQSNIVTAVKAKSSKSSIDGINNYTYDRLQSFADTSFGGDMVAAVEFAINMLTL